jgi:hypothetical protein
MPALHNLEIYQSANGASSVPHGKFLSEENRRPWNGFSRLSFVSVIVVSCNGHGAEPRCLLSVVGSESIHSGTWRCRGLLASSLACALLLLRPNGRSCLDSALHSTGCCRRWPSALFSSYIYSEPSLAWLSLLKSFQADIFAGLVRLIVTTRTFHFEDRLGGLRGLTCLSSNVQWKSVMRS